VAKATATLSLADLTVAYDGTPKALVVSVEPTGFTDISLDYAGSPSAPSDAGSYLVTATLDDPNYAATPATALLVITPLAATLSLSDLNQTYDGTPRAVTVTTDPAGLNVAVTYNGDATVPTEVGSYTVVATLADTNYSAPSDQRHASHQPSYG